MSQVVLSEPRVASPAINLSGWPGYAVSGLFIVAFLPLWIHYWTVWTADESAFGFGYFVPPSVAYLVWANRDLLRDAPESSPRRTGWFVLGSMVLLQCVACLAEFRLLEGAAMMGIVLAGASCLLGPGKYRVIWPSLAYTATMIPWPGDLTSGLLFRLQQLSIGSSVWVFRQLGLRPTAEASLLTLPHFQFEVAPACAGLTVLFPVVACAIFTAITLQARLSRKFLYVALAAPISVVTNTLRIVLIGLIGNGGGAKLAMKLHDASGIVLVLICLGILSLAGRLIGCRKLLPQYAPSKEQKEQTV